MKFEHETDAAAAHIQKVLRYCPTTGLLFWKAAAGRAKADAEAGNLTHHGYRRVGVLGRYFLAHRIAWLLCTGRWPVGLLDHRDQDKLNNRFENLREGDKSLNALNVSAPRADTCTGLPGVGWVKARRAYRARLCVNGERKTLGYWPTAQEAHEAYAAAKTAIAAWNQ